MSGGKPKQPEARTIAVKLPTAERGLLLDLCHRRVLAGKAYEDTTMAGVVRDAIRALHKTEVGTMLPTVPVEVPDSALETSTPESVANADQLQAEYQAFTTAEGVSNLPWDQFLTIRKLRMQKGGWKYGPNQ